MTQFVVGHEILVFGRDGAHLRTLGRQGAGPGEFRHAATLDVHAADSVFVFDNGNMRLSVFGPDLTLARTEPLPGGFTYKAVLIDGGIVLNATLPTREGIGFPLHLVRTNAQPVSFGSVDGGALSGPSPVHMMRALAPAREGGVWAATRTDYAVTHWSPDGDRLSHIVRRARWFEPYSDRVIGGPDAPQPFLLAIREIAPGRIMTLIGVPKPDYLDRRGQPIGQSDRGEPLYDLSRRQELHDTIVEVLDVAEGRLLLSRRIGAYLIGFADDGHVYGYRLDGDDVPRIDTYSIRFTEN